jgi:predicted CXXCH cytochrome family protein
MRKLLAVPAVLAALAAASPAQAAGARVAGSKHDLSVTGPGPIRAVSERSACAFCHVSHNSGEGLTARPDPRGAYSAYQSPTLQARPGAPTGASRICLSCHDGTIAVGETRTRRIEVTGAAGGRIPGSRRSHLGTDLRRTHPISFRPLAGRSARAPAPSDAVRLDHSGQVQCTSCHDPHAEWAGDPVEGKFLVKPLARSALCLSCHEAIAYEVPGGSHALSGAPLPPGDETGSRAATVGEAGCQACHASHATEAGARLVRRPAGDDDAACLRCHGGGNVRRPLAADLAKRSSHAGLGRGVHDPSEGLPAAGKLRAGPAPAARRHAACVDCHNPHAASAQPGLGGVPGALAGVWGVDAAGNRVEQIRFEYEVCFKCHGDGQAAPLAAAAPRPGTPRRARPDENLRRVFDPSGPSSHAVVAPGAAADVPSLLAPWTPGSTLTCSDCHGSDDRASGGGARGPHGSNHPFLLARAYTTGDPSIESPASYALCYGCHDREVLLSDRSAFPLHRRHVVGERTACATCHVAHGVSALGGSAQANAHLIDFDLAAVGATPLGPPRYESLGSRRGSCTLSCHGAAHDRSTY